MVEIYTVDSFTRQRFKGNPACVCTSFRDKPHSATLDTLFQQIATEMNVSETAFITRASSSLNAPRFFLQWFSPTNEVELCGHATLATGHIIFERSLVNSTTEEVIFETKKAGELKVRKCDTDGRLQMDFPIGDPQPVELDRRVLDEIKQKLNMPLEQNILDVQLCKRTKKLLLHVESISDSIRPQRELTEIDFDKAIKPFVRGIILTSPSTSTTADFISRYFSPWNGILEDPVTGGAHTVLAVYWSRLLKNQKSVLLGYQNSARGGYVECELNQTDGRILLRGHAITVMQGQLLLSLTDSLNTTESS